jgi:hypothetical protein
MKMQPSACSFAVMQMRPIKCLVAVLILLACNNPKTQSEDDFSDFTPPVDSLINTTEPVYPFLDYVRSQIAMVDTIPYAIERIQIIDGVTKDSSFVNKEVFKKEAGAFLEINPNDTDLRKQYIETSFNDLTLGLVTFSITAQDPGLKLQQADILVNPDNNAVKNIILRKQFSNADSSVEQTLLWKDKMNFQISEVISKKDQPAYNRVLKIIWDKPLE